MEPGGIIVATTLVLTESGGLRVFRESIGTRAVSVSIRI